MSKRNNKTQKKQLQLSKWLKEEERITNQSEEFETQKPKLAFGYGYNPIILKNGIEKYSFSHEVEEGLRLYKFSPKISYRIFNELAKILKYKCLGNELRKDNTTIKNNYFTTDENPKKIIKELDNGIKKLFETYDALPKCDI